MSHPTFRPILLLKIDADYNSPERLPLLWGEEGEMLVLLLQFYGPCFLLNLKTCNKKKRSQPILPKYWPGNYEHLPLLTFQFKEESLKALWAFTTENKLDFCTNTTDNFCCWYMTFDKACDGLLIIAFLFNQCQMISYTIPIENQKASTFRTGI